MFSWMSVRPSLGPVSSTVAWTPVSPSLIALLNQFWINIGHQVGAVIPSRPPGTGCGVFDSVSPFSAP